MTTRQIKTFGQMLEGKQTELVDRIQRLRDRLPILERGDRLDRMFSPEAECCTWSFLLGGDWCDRCLFWRPHPCAGIRQRS